MLASGRMASSRVRSCPRPRRPAPSYTPFSQARRRAGALDGERVLLLAADRVLVRQDLGALAQRDRPLRGHGRVDHAPAQRRRVQRLVPPRRTVLRLEESRRGTAHRLHAAGQDRCVADPDRAGRMDDRLHPRAAEPVDRRPGHAGRQPGEQPRHPGHVAVVLAGPVRVAEQDVVDARGVEPTAVRRDTSSRMPSAARSSGRIPLSPPAYLPIGVRTASTTHTSLIAGPSSSRGAAAPSAPARWAPAWSAGRVRPPGPSPWPP